MARQILTRVLCDICLTDKEVEVEGVETDPIAIGNRRPLRLALCQEHEQPFHGFIEMLLQYGTLVDKEKVLKTSPAKSTAGPAAGGQVDQVVAMYDHLGLILPDGRYQCPSCSSSTSNRKTLRDHYRKLHGEVLGNWERAKLAELQESGDLPAVQETVLECSECDRTFSTATLKRPQMALTIHRRKEHGLAAGE